MTELCSMIALVGATRGSICKIAHHHHTNKRDHQCRILYVYAKSPKQEMICSIESGVYPNQSTDAFLRMNRVEQSRREDEQAAVRATDINLDVTQTLQRVLHAQMGDRHENPLSEPG